MSVVLSLCGEAALSPFRIEKLLQQAARLQLDCNIQINSEYRYFVASATELDSGQQQKLLQLLRATHQNSNTLTGTQLLVTPRLGTISPWASKATDIAHNCGLNVIERIERGILYSFSRELSQQEQDSWQTILHDRMTESVLTAVADAAQLFHTTAAKS